MNATVIIKYNNLNPRGQKSCMTLIIPFNWEKRVRPLEMKVDTIYIYTYIHTHICIYIYGQQFGTVVSAVGREACFAQLRGFKSRSNSIIHCIP